MRRNLWKIIIIGFFCGGCSLPMLDVHKHVVLETVGGPIEIKLLPDAAPKACENFAGLVKSGYYNGVIFHRVIENFMIQGGDPTGTGTGGDSIWGGPFQDEVSDSVQFDRPYLVAMANAGPNTNKSQFFITTVGPLERLNMHYTIFGEVVDGFDAVVAIEKTRTDDNDRPLDEQKIVKAYLK